MRASWPLLAAFVLVAACSERGDERAQSTPATDVASVNQDDASSATVFDLTSGDRRALEERAVAGDAEASFRLAQYYSFSGTGWASDAGNERRWLELATRQGHRIAKHNLAVLVADDDCPRAVAMMQELAESATTPEEAQSAASWLEESSFQC